MVSEMDLSSTLETLEAEWSVLTEVPDPPRSMLSIVEYSLGSQRKAELYINRLLRYFLDPSEPHGMGTEFLRSVLEELPTECGFDQPLRDLSDVRVSDQVRVSMPSEDSWGEDASRIGDVDLVIERPGEWALLMEIKFSAGENRLDGDGRTQTEFYQDAPLMRGRDVAEYDSGQYFLYLHPDGESASVADGFVDWTWEAFVTTTLVPFLDANGPRYPHRTVVQLHEFIDDIQAITDMTDDQPSKEDKFDLYIDHYAAISDITTAFDEQWEQFCYHWDDRLEATLDEKAHDHVGWVFYPKSSSWGHLFKREWWRHTETNKEIEQRPNDRNDARISFVHRPDHSRDTVFDEEELRFHFRNAGANEQAFIDVFKEEFDRVSEDIDEALPDAAELTGQKKNLITATYSIPIETHDDFRDAYVAALEQAFVEHVIEPDRLIAHLDEVYERSFAMYE